jgi:VCBS repeat-containing protein
MNRMTTNGATTILTLPQWQALGYDQHSLVATPAQLFVNAPGFDFHLSATSPAVDAGTSSFAPAVDLEGNARPSGAAVDIGAFERNGTPPPPPVNDPPSDITLSGSTVKENAANGTIVGTLTAADPDAGDTHTFTLVDNASGRFGISGNRIVVANGALLNYEAGTSHSVTVRATDAGGLTYDESFTIGVQNVNEIVSFDVQKGANQRSYIRYVDLVFESADGLAQLIAEGRIKLQQFSPTGSFVKNVSLSGSGRMQVIGNRIAINFGKEGIGGKRNSATGNGWYRFALDTDDNGSFETYQRFYRLLGDTNGDRVVNWLDQQAVAAAMGQTGKRDADVNGDSIVNWRDRDLVKSQLGKSISATLPLDD